MAAGYGETSELCQTSPMNKSTLCNSIHLQEDSGHIGDYKVTLPGELALFVVFLRLRLFLFFRLASKEGKSLAYHIMGF